MLLAKIILFVVKLRVIFDCASQPLFTNTAEVFVLFFRSSDYI